MPSDASLNYYLAYGTNAARLAFTPSPPTPAAGPGSLYIWFETDTGNSYAYDTAWHALGGGGSGGTFAGAGNPEGVQTAVPGNTYWDQSNLIFYVKDTGIGDTGWRELLA